MKTTLTKLVIALCLVAGSASVSLWAQMNQRALAHIPFEFQVAGRNLPAGNYSMTDLDARGVIKFTNQENFGSILVSGAIPDSGNSGEGKLVFHRYGDEYFLQGIWMPDGRAYLLRPGRRERELHASVSGPARVATLAVR